MTTWNAVKTIWLHEVARWFGRSLPCLLSVSEAENGGRGRRGRRLRGRSRGGSESWETRDRRPTDRRTAPGRREERPRESLNLRWLRRQEQSSCATRARGR